MRSILLLSLASIAVLSTGCGGGGDSSSSTPSPFAGHWQGLFNDPVNNQTGTLDVTVATNGSATGSVHNATTGLDGTVAGGSSNLGAANLTYTYPNATYTANGIITINNSGHLVGNFTTKVGNTVVGTASIDLTKS